jgi:hypothetical protein
MRLMTHEPAAVRVTPVIRTKHSRKKNEMIECRVSPVGRLRAQTLVASRASLLRSLTRDAGLTRWVQLVR